MPKWYLRRRTIGRLKARLRHARRWMSAIQYPGGGFFDEEYMKRSLEVTMIFVIHHPGYKFYSNRRKKLEKILSSRTNSSGAK